MNGSSSVIIKTWLASTILNFNENKTMFVVLKPSTVFAASQQDPGPLQPNKASANQDLVSQWKVIKTNHHF